MLAEARAAASTARIELVEASAESLPFADGEFDALTFTYLLRYVDDPAATLRELARVVRPGGTIARARVRRAAASGGRCGSSTCASACRSRARSSAAAGTTSAASSARRSATSTRAAARRPLEAWRAAGIATSRARRLSLGGGVVTWGRQAGDECGPRSTRSRPGGWRDYVTLLHLPYTLWHLSYVALGAAIAPRFISTGMLWTLARSRSRSASAPTRSTS